MQMYCAQFDYCDFVTWSKQEMNVERIYIDMTFLEENLVKAFKFHKFVVIPELLGKYYTKPKDDVVIYAWCECCQPADGRDMVKCSNEACSIQWYHIECVDASDVLNSKLWQCDDCEAQMSAEVLNEEMDFMDWEDSAF